MNDKRFLLIMICCFVSLQCWSQFGVKAKYNNNSYSAWEEAGIAVDHSNIEVGLDYWFKLKNHRIEFMPEVYYGLSTETTYPIAIGRELFLKQSYVGLQMNTHIYIMDLESDCNCPTFSKDGPSIKKGFFINIAPGAVFNMYDRNSGVTNVPNFSTQNINLRVALGVGYDIGINDLLTVTPFVNYLLSTGNNAEFFTPENQEITSSWTSFQGGVRVGFRPDYNNGLGGR